MSLTPSDAHPAGTGLGVPDPQLLDWHPKKPINQPKNNKNKTQTNKKTQQYSGWGRHFHSKVLKYKKHVKTGLIIRNSKQAMLP